MVDRGALAAAGDSLGRVLLIDTATLTVVRLWKAYRHAQLAWLSLPHRQPPGDKASPAALINFPAHWVTVAAMKHHLLGLTDFLTCSMLTSQARLTIPLLVGWGG